MSCTCHQCGYVFGSHGELGAHLLSEHGLNVNPATPRSLPNLYEIVEKLSKRVGTLEGRIDLLEEAADLEDAEDED